MPGAKPVRLATRKMWVSTAMVVPEGGVEHDVGGLAAHARQRLEFGAGVRHPPAVTLDQQPAGLEDIARLGVVQADGLYIRLEARQSELRDRPRGVRDREQFGGRLVDALVGRLGRQYHRDQQLERAAIAQLGGRRRIGRLEALEKFASFRRAHA